MANDGDVDLDLVTYLVRNPGGIPAAIATLAHEHAELNDRVLSGPQPTWPPTDAEWRAQTTGKLLTLRAGQAELRAGQTELREGMTEMQAGMTEMQASITEMRAGMVALAKIVGATPEQQMTLFDDPNPNPG